MAMRGRVIGACAAGALLLGGAASGVSLLGGARAGALAEAPAGSAKEPTLEVVQVVFRHGALLQKGWAAGHHGRGALCSGSAAGVGMHVADSGRFLVMHPAVCTCPPPTPSPHNRLPGARTPLGALYWPELVDKWDVCGKAYDPVPLDIRMEDGSPRRPNPDDVKQVRGGWGE